MPICTTCTHPTPYLYTVYESAYNFRLEQCPACHAFADPYVEHDTLTLVLDLILLKRDVYRHLLFNRGTGARMAGQLQDRGEVMSDVTQNDTMGGRITDVSEIEKQREKARWLLICRLGSALILIDAIIRWAHLHPDKPLASSDFGQWTVDACQLLLRTLVGCLVETVAFHTGIILACYVVLKCINRWRSWRHSTSGVSGTRQEFRLSHVPLTLLYSSLTKLFLLLLLSIWHPVPPSTSDSQPASPPHGNGWNTTFQHPIILGALEIFDEDSLDRDWVIRNVLGGMAAGFGLRVVLDCHPVFTTIIIIVGWAVKTAAGGLVSGWVGGDQESGEAWLAYSIP